MNDYEKLSEEVEKLRSELKDEQEFSSGILAALKQVLIALLPENQKMAKALADDWRESSADFLAEDGESHGLLEARHLLYRQLDLLGVWPQSAPDPHP